MLAEYKYFVFFVLFFTTKFYTVVCFSSTDSCCLLLSVSQAGGGRIVICWQMLILSAKASLTIPSSWHVSSIFQFFLDQPHFPERAEPGSSEGHRRTPARCPAASHEPQLEALHRKVVSWFGDHPSAPFGVHQLVAGKGVGEESGGLVRPVYSGTYAEVRGEQVNLIMFRFKSFFLITKLLWFNVFSSTRKAVARTWVSQPGCIRGTGLHGWGVMFSLVGGASCDHLNWNCLQVMFSSCFCFCVCCSV